MLLEALAALRFPSLVPPRRASAAAWTCWVAALCCAAAACRGPQPSSVARLPEPATAAQTSAPPALFQPLSWEKLEALELWLAGPGERASSAMRLEVELALAEGRTSYAKLDRAKLTPAQLKTRVDLAREGFQRVRSSTAASSAQAERARAGLAGLDALTPKTQPFLPELITRAQWGAAPSVLSRLIRNDQGWSRITVHHSADSNGERTAGSASDARQALRNLQRFHMNDPGHRWGDIGYHFLIDPQGRIYEGRPLTWQGAHAGGDANQRNIGICVLGDYLKGRPPQAEIDALHQLVESLRARFQIPRSQIYGHQEFKGTDCPGPVLMGWVKSYRAKSSSSSSSETRGAKPKAASRAGEP